MAANPIDGRDPVDNRHHVPVQGRGGTADVHERNVGSGADVVVDTETDVVVCGAGTAGLQAALQLALVGCRVVVVEERGERKSGARWCNGVLAWQFERAGLRPPDSAERRHSSGRVRMSSPSRNVQFTIDGSPIIDVDMRAVVDRLRSDAEAAGVEFVWKARNPRLASDGGRPSVLTADVDGVERRWRARLFVDATGLTAALRRQVPALARACPDAPPEDCCSARQMVFEIASVDGARQFLADEGAEPGDAVDHVGLAGGYSVEVISIEPDLAQVSILVGTLADGRYGDAASMMAAVRERHPWIGKPVFGGGGVIPLRRPYTRLAVPGLALVGDAGSQVMAAHGSGVGFGLMAGKVLAEAVAEELARSEDVGGPSAMWRYQADYHREFGAILMGYDIFRRFSSRIDSDGVQELFAAELFDARIAAPGLAQELGTIPIHDLPDRARAMATNPAVARRLLPALLRMQAARALHLAYPTTPDDRRLERWDRLAERLTR